MESLKTYFESILDKTSKKVKVTSKEIKKVHNEFLNKIKAMCKSSYHRTYLSQDDYTTIMDTYVEVDPTDTKGRKWYFVTPDPNASFNLIAISNKIGEWYKPQFRDMSSEKELVKAIKRNESFGNKVCLPNIRSVADWVLGTFTNVNGGSGSDWHTMQVIYEFRGGMYYYYTLSFNMKKHEWFWGVPSDTKIPKQMLMSGARINQYWSAIVEAFEDADRYGRGYAILNIETVKHIKALFKPGNISDVKNDKDGWYSFYIGKRFSIQQDGIFWLNLSKGLYIEGKLNVALTKEIQAEIDAVQNAKWSFGRAPKLSISKNTANYIKVNYTSDDNLSLGIWVKDESTGDYMSVNFKEKKWKYLRGEYAAVAGGWYD